MKSTLTTKPGPKADRGNSKEQPVESLRVRTGLKAGLNFTKIQFSY